LLKSDVSITKSDVSVSMFRLDHERGGDTGAKIAVVSQCLYKNDLFYQDRLGTNIRRESTQKRDAFRRALSWQRQDLPLVSASRLKTSGAQVRKTHIFCDAILLLLKPIILPRQARDKHRENSKRERRFQKIGVVLVTAFPTGCEVHTLLLWRYFLLRLNGSFYQDRLGTSSKTEKLQTKLMAFLFAESTRRGSTPRLRTVRQQLPPLHPCLLLTPITLTHAHPQTHAHGLLIVGWHSIFWDEINVYN
jgi:hypothetical protein